MTRPGLFLAGSGRGDSPPDPKGCPHAATAFSVLPGGDAVEPPAAYVPQTLRRLPKPGERLERDGLRFGVLGATPRRIERLRVVPLGEVSAA